MTDAAQAGGDRAERSRQRHERRRLSSPEIVDKLAWTAAFGARRGAARHGALDHSQPGGGGGHPPGVDSRPVHGDGPRRGGRLHGAGDQRARDGLRHGARRHPVGEERSNAGAFIFEIARSEIGYTEQRPHEYAAIVLAAALREGFTRPDLHPGRSRPDQRQEVQQPRSRQGARHAARAHQGRDRRRASTTSTSTPRRWSIWRSRRSTSSRKSTSSLAADFAAFIRKHEPHGVTVSVGGEIGEVGGKNSDVHELHAYMEGFNRELKERGADLVGLSKISVQTGTAHGGFVNADGTRAHRREDRSEDARGAVARRARRVRPGRRRAARRVDAAAGGVRRVPARRRLRDPPRHRLPEHGLRAPAVPGRPEGRDVRVGPRERARGAEAEGHRGAVHLQGAEEGDRPVQAAHVGHCRRAADAPSASRSRSGSRS